MNNPEKIETYPFSKQSMDNSQNDMRLVFVGPANGVKPYVVLQSLLNWPLIRPKHILVVTDMESGATALTQLCHNSGFQLHITSDKCLKSDITVLQDFSPHFLVACGWGHRISTDVLAIPTIAALNCHSSCLPDYKGSSVYNHYWANCEQWAGATVHIMTEKFDAGNIISQQKIRIYRWDTPGTILWRLSELTSCLLREAILLVDRGYKGLPQSGGRYFYKISSRRLKLYRFYNRWATLLGLPRYMTPHKEIE